MVAGRTGRGACFFRRSVKGLPRFRMSGVIAAARLRTAGSQVRPPTARAERIRRFASNCSAISGERSPAAARARRAISSSFCLANDNHVRSSGSSCVSASKSIGMCIREQDGAISIRTAPARSIASRRNHQRARTSDYEQRERGFQTVSEEKRQNRKNSSRRRVPAREAVDEPFHRGLLNLRFFDPAHNPRQGCPSTDPIRPQPKGPIPADAPGEDCGPRKLLNRQRFTRDRTFVDRRATVHNFAGGGDAGAFANQQNIAGAHILRRNLDRHPSFRTVAFSGSRSSRLDSASRVRLSARASSRSPSTNSAATAAASVNSPSKRAPVIATVTSSSIEICRRRSLCQAHRAILVTGGGRDAG